MNKIEGDFIVGKLKGTVPTDKKFPDYFKDIGREKFKARFKVKTKRKKNAS